MDLKTLAEFTTLPVRGNSVTSEAQGCQTRKGLERAVSMFWELKCQIRNPNLTEHQGRAARLNPEEKEHTTLPTVVKVVYCGFRC